MIGKIAFIGLGVMGFPMAGWLSKAGYSVSVFNRTEMRAKKWLEQFSGSMSQTPLEATKEASIICICVGNDDDVLDVMMGPTGILDGLSSGAVVIDHTTTSAALSKRLSKEVSSRNCSFIDAPVSGGQQGAENGSLTTMCGGDAAAFLNVKEVIESFSRAVTLMGPSGSGQLCKMVNQICIAGVVQGLAEGINFAERAGLDAHQVIDVISKGAAQSWQMENRYKTMLSGDYEHGFAVQWMRKDLAVALEEGQENGSALSLVELVDRFYAEVQDMGGNRWDTSSLLARLKV
ncbi:MAG: oxidoreductase [Porticoccaceae bacterium]|nr:oxidoreductase [Porticoccaceae bacterium]